MINRNFFFDYARRPFRGRMTQSRSTGLNAILDACEATYAKKDDRCLAYGSAPRITTNAKMQPINKYGASNSRGWSESSARSYEQRPHRRPSA